MVLLLYPIPYTLVFTIPHTYIKMAKVKIYISPKKEILDPQGTVVENALRHLGFEGTSKVRVGKYITLESKEGDEAKIKEMCEKLLSNPLIEDYTFEVIT